MHAAAAHAQCEAAAGHLLLARDDANDGGAVERGRGKDHGQVRAYQNPQCASSSYRQNLIDLL